RRYRACRRLHHGDAAAIQPDARRFAGNDESLELGQMISNKGAEAMLTRWVGLALWIMLMATEPVFAGEKPKENAAKEPRKVAILIFDGVELLDFTGPAEVFTVAGEGKLFRVFTVAEKSEPIRTMGGITVKPEFALKDAPKADILVIPGGGMRNVG